MNTVVNSQNLFKVLVHITSRENTNKKRKENEVQRCLLILTDGPQILVLLVLAALCQFQWSRN